ncbi:right-handed parallel beta-helix repeat-containing protein, partial [Massilia cavernae]
MPQDFGQPAGGQYPGMEASVPYRRALPATPYTLYVSPAGSDGNSGTRSSPFRSIARASRSARPGTTVLVAPGSYAGGFRTSANGTPAARIYYVSEVKWGATIVPPARPARDMAWDNRGSFTDIAGFEVDGAAGQGGAAWRYGIYNGGSYAVIRDNWIHHMAQGVACTSEGGSAIGVDSYYRGVQSEVIGNLVHDIGPPGCHYIQGIYVSTSGAVRNNVVYRVAQGAIHLWHDARDIVVSNNTVAASGSGIIVG